MRCTDKLLALLRVLLLRVLLPRELWGKAAREVNEGVTKERP